MIWPLPASPISFLSCSNTELYVEIGVFLFVCLFSEQSLSLDAFEYQIFSGPKCYKHPSPIDHHDHFNSSLPGDLLHWQFRYYSSSSGNPPQAFHAPKLSEGLSTISYSILCFLSSLHLLYLICSTVMGS